MTGSTSAAPARARAGGPPIEEGCRLCGASLDLMVVDLGVQPLCESYVEPERYREPEPCWPLQAFVCESCWLIQVPALVGGEEIYRHYAYFSSYSDSWLAHARRFVEGAIERFDLDDSTQVVEIASNDGYLLQYTRAAGIPSLGIEPAANVAATAREKGIETVVRFFGEATARDLVDEGVRADLLVANNVIGHVPALDDFLEGMRILLADEGVASIEIPHAMRTLEGNQFDQIYQEHYSYWLFLSLERALADHGLVVFDVEELSTHGGSMRVHARHVDDPRPVEPSVEALRECEIEAGYTDPATYAAFGERVAETKRRLLEFLIEARREGKRVAAYGAPGKGNTLLNYCGIREDLVEFTVDRNPFKQGKYLPGTRIPIHSPDRIGEEKPDVILLLPWNLREELLDQLDYARAWGATFVVPIPEPEVIA